MKRNKSRKPLKVQIQELEKQIRREQDPVTKESLRQRLHYLNTLKD